MATSFAPWLCLAMKALNTPRPRLWSFDNIEFDEAQLELRVAGIRVSIQPLALQLLACLLQGSPQVVRREELFERLWHRAPELVSRNVLSNATARLRSAIGDPAGRRVVTVAGLGYRFEGPLRSSASAASEHTSLQLPPPAREFLMRQWFDALHGRQGFDPRLSLCDVLRRAIGQAEIELAAAPLSLAGLHQHLAEHDLIWSDHESAARHFRRAMALHAEAGEKLADDAALGLHFDLCRTLTLAAVTSGDTSALQRSRDELSVAQSALTRQSRPTIDTRLKAALADWAIAGFDLDWPRAQRASDQAIHLASQLPDLALPQWFSLHRNRGVTLARAGQLAAGIEALRALLATPLHALAPDDIQILVTRLNLGQFQWLAGRAPEAAATLQTLRDSLRGNAVSLTTFGVETDVWLAKAWIDTDRAAGALSLLTSAHERACQLKGASSELALCALVPWTTLLWRAGEHETALQKLEDGLAPRLSRLAMPGQREAVVALAHWIRLLWQAGPQRQAQVQDLLRHLRPGDLQAAALRPADAADFAAGLRRTVAAQPPPPTHRTVVAGKRSRRVC